MVTGKTGEKILVTGSYKCQGHPAIEKNLIKDDTFPRCEQQDNHPAVWVLKEDAESKNQDDQKGNKPKDKEKNTEKQDEKEKDPKKTSKPEENTDDELKKVYNRKGFYAALRYKKNPADVSNTLEALINEEKKNAEEEISNLRQVHNEKIVILKEEFLHIERLLEEKLAIRKEFVEGRAKMEEEYRVLKEKVEKLNEELGKEMEALGKAKEGLISKRIEEFEKELDKITDVYQRLEDKQNSKFRRDFENKNLQQRDKHFYYDYRDKLQSSFNEVQKRVRLLEQEGLNLFVARFLVSLGWIAVLVSSWFFIKWYSEASHNTDLDSGGILVFILDGITSFVIHNHWAVSLAVFTFYIAIVFFVSWFCYKTLSKEHDKQKNSKKESAENQEDKIEVDTENEGLIKAKVKANNWYELWLKIAPLLTIVFLLIIILAVGKYQDAPPGVVSNMYEQLSDAMALQFISILLPLSYTVLFFLYITYIESKVLHQSDDNHATPPLRRKAWEILGAMTAFLVLIILLISYYVLGIHALSNIHAWGFFIGCLCTAFALSYGYRFISLNKSFYDLVDRLDDVNRYIHQTFYPFEISYSKSAAIQFRKSVLYYSVIRMVEYRNELAAKLLNRFYNPAKQTEVHEQYPKSSKTVAQNKAEQEWKVQNENIKRSIEWMKKVWFLKPVLIFFYNKIKALRTRSKTAENELKEIKGNKVDIDELTYFPEQAAKIKELKLLIDEKTRQMNELRAELDGYFKNEKTYASLNQQIENLQKNKNELAAVIEKLSTEIAQRIKTIEHILTQKINYIQEGYIIGDWYADNYKDDDNDGI